MPAHTQTPVEDKVLVGIGELAVTDDRSAVLVTYSLGSCLGVAIYDPVVRVGGLWHPMLPDSAIDPEKAARRPGMFVNSGWPVLVRSAAGLGARLERLALYVAGGAQVLDPDGVFYIGRHNVQALRRLLKEAELPVMGEEIGGVENRTVQLCVGDGLLRIKCPGRTEEIQL